MNNRTDTPEASVAGAQRKLPSIEPHVILEGNESIRGLRQEVSGLKYFVRDRNVAKIKMMIWTRSQKVYGRRT